MAQQGSKLHTTRTPKRIAKTPLPKGKTLKQVRDSKR